MNINKNHIAGTLLWISLALLMVRGKEGFPELASSEFIVGFILGLWLSYRITAYLLGWVMPMLTFTGGLKKGENDLLRLIAFLVFSLIWLLFFFR